MKSQNTHMNVRLEVCEENLERGFIELAKMLEKRMDPLKPKFHAASPHSVKDYWNACNIVESGGGGGEKPTPHPPMPPNP